MIRPRKRVSNIFLGKTWRNIRILLCVDVPLGLLIRVDDIFIQGAGLNKYYLTYHLFSILLLLLFLFSSNLYKRKYHQAYFLISTVGL